MVYKISYLDMLDRQSWCCVTIFNMFATEKQAMTELIQFHQAAYLLLGNKRFFYLYQYRGFLRDNEFSIKNVMGQIKFCP